MKLFCGNLSYQTTEVDLRTLFERFGDVKEAKVISDRETGRSRGFGFITMGDEDAKAAMSELDGKDFDGRSIVVNEAKAKEQGGGGRPLGGGGNRRDDRGGNGRRDRY